MNALIVYESMFGNTRRVAEAVYEALATAGVESTMVIAAAAPRELDDYELVIVGAPTHAHTLPQPTSRIQAGTWADDPEKKLQLEPNADEPGVREWLDRIAPPDLGVRFAAFSTRVDIPRLFSGDAAAAIERRLHKRGVQVAVHEDFLVDKDSHLLDGEEQRAKDWATELVGATVR